MLVLGMVMYFSEGFYPSPGLTVPDYSYAAWGELAGPEDVPPSPLVLVPPGSWLLAGVWFLLTTCCLLGDGERFLSKVCGVRSNRIDYEWHVIIGVVWPLLVLLVALLLGTHDIFVLAATVLLSSFAGILAQLAENICKLVNLEAGNGAGFTSHALPMLRAWHDWILMLNAVLVLFPWLCMNATPARTQVSVLQDLLGTGMVCLSLSLAVIQRGHHRFLRRVQNTWPCKLLREYESSEAAALPPPDGGKRPGKLHNLLRKLAAPRLDRGEELYENLYGTRVHVEQQQKQPPRSRSVSTADGHPGSNDMPDDAFNRLYGCQVVAGTAITLPPKYEINADLQWVPITSIGLRDRDALAPRFNPYTSVDTHEEDARCARMRVMYLVEWRRHYVINALINVVLLASLFELDATGWAALRVQGAPGNFAASE